MATTDDLHHHGSVQVRGTITPSVVRPVWKQRYTPQNKNLGISSYTKKVHHSKTNEQSGFNAEQIEKKNISGE